MSSLYYVHFAVLTSRVSQNLYQVLNRKDFVHAKVGFQGLHVSISSFWGCYNSLINFRVVGGGIWSFSCILAFINIVVRCPFCYFRDKAIKFVWHKTCKIQYSICIKAYLSARSELIQYILNDILHILLAIVLVNFTHYVLKQNAQES
jgi:hypothetical protein